MALFYVHSVLDVVVVVFPSVVVEVVVVQSSVLNAAYAAIPAVTTAPNDLLKEPH